MVQVTIRKAAKIAKSLLEIANEAKHPTHFVASFYEKNSIAEEAGVHQTRLRSGINATLELIRASYEIRASIGAINAEKGVNNLLARMAMLTARDKVLASIGGKSASKKRRVYGYEPEPVVNAVEPAVAERMKDEFAAWEPGSQRPAATVQVSSLNPEISEFLEKERIKIRKELSDINDQLISINTINKVTLSPEVAVLASTHGLI